MYPSPSTRPFRAGSQQLQQLHKHLRQHPHRRLLPLEHHVAAALQPQRVLDAGRQLLLLFLVVIVLNGDSRQPLCLRHAPRQV